MHNNQLITKQKIQLMNYSWRYHIHNNQSDKNITITHYIISTNHRQLSKILLDDWASTSTTSNDYRRWLLGSDWNQHSSFQTMFTDFQLLDKKNSTSQTIHTKRGQAYTRFRQGRQSRGEPNRLRSTLLFQTGKPNITFRLAQLMTRSTSETKVLQSRSERLQQSIFLNLAHPVAPN